ncbi:tripartite tricarboxylate transporter TctB family protein [Stutzerimonas azotifigens]|uniref:Tripartite tricarboxylate transporter TctB family protein n=1 Tax=Stutzerimonas azotifigens TaxID=291995 RepID=A0ABR5Z3U3_9GAMM|nr:tripartite tricarboxylate transporter TctB family protein [Stutzerimonas azotifigens]MBA1274888.1 tripartite tricarboxylate transporter TctB family protein [Stutzerimonas azotifigens]
MNINRLVLGLFGIGIAAVFFVNAQGYPKAAAEMPLIYSVTVALLSAAMVCSELLRWRAASRQAIGESEGEAVAEPTLRPRYGAAAVVFALACGYVFAITTLGYLLSTALFMGLALAMIRTVSVRFAVIATVVLVAMVCVVFVQFLGLPVPLLPLAIS